MNAAVPFFKETISTDDRLTTAMVDIVANDIGKYMTPRIKTITKSGGIFSMKRSNDPRC